jgi:hypothetical protein
MTQQAPAQLYQTSDYGQAAFLLARGFGLKTTKASEGEVGFQFDASAELLSAIADYSSNAEIPCRDYFHALRRTKILIHKHTENFNDRERSSR